MLSLRRGDSMLKRILSDYPWEGTRGEAVPVIPLDNFGNVITGGGAGSSSTGGTGYQSPGDFASVYASATTLSLSQLPFPPLLEQFSMVVEYDGDNKVAEYDISDTTHAWSWTPGADTSSGVLTVTGAAFGATNTFTVLLSGPERDILDFLGDVSGLTVHASPAHFSAAYASGTTIAITGMAMDPDASDIRGVVELASDGRARMGYSRKEWAFTWAAGAAGAGTLTIAAADLQATSTFVVFIAGPEHHTSAANTARTTGTIVKQVQHMDPAGKAQLAGADPDSALYARQLGVTGQMGGDGIFRSPIDFTAAYQAATVLQLSGSFPAITDVTQFLAVRRVDSSGAQTVYFPSTNVFTWASGTSRLTVAGATFDGTDIAYEVVVSGTARAFATAENAVNTITQNPSHLYGVPVTVLVQENIPISTVTVYKDVSNYRAHKLIQLKIAGAGITATLSLSAEPGTDPTTKTYFTDASLPAYTSTNQWWIDYPVEALKFEFNSTVATDDVWCWMSLR
jgi:hypothetical protein